MSDGIEFYQSHCGRDGCKIYNFHFHWIDRLVSLLLRGRQSLATEMALRVEILLEFWIVRAEEVFKELMCLIFENLSFFSAMRVIHHSNDRFVNLKYL